MDAFFIFQSIMNTGGIGYLRISLTQIEQEELKTPRVGGIIIWFTVLLITIIFYLVSIIFPVSLTLKLNFLSRNQTLIPFFSLLLGSLLGLWDDLMQIYGKGKIARDDKSWRFWKILIIICVSLLIGIWFYFKLIHKKK